MYQKATGFIGDVNANLPADLNEIVVSDWNAHLFTIDRRKCLVFMNNLTFYTVFLTDILKKDLKEIDTLFQQRLEEQLVYDKLIESLKEAELLFPKKKIQFYKTNNNRKVIGRINDFVSIFKCHYLHRYEHIRELDVVYENGLINTIPTGKLFEKKKSWSSAIQNVKDLQNGTLEGVNR